METKDMSTKEEYNLWTEEEYNLWTDLKRVLADLEIMRMINPNKPLSMTITKVEEASLWFDKYLTIPRKLKD